MYSFAFPNMLSSARANLVQDKEAVRSNLYLLLNTERLSLFGDPYFGTALKKAMFEQAHTLVVDLFIDEIYTTILTFLPQLHVERKNITLFAQGTSLYARVKCTYVLDNTSDLFVIHLTDYESL